MNLESISNTFNQHSVIQNKPPVMLIKTNNGYQAYKVQKTDLQLPQSASLYTPTVAAPPVPKDD